MKQRIIDGLRAVWDEVRMPRVLLWRRLPGLIAVGLLTLAVGLWTLWSVAEMFYEGWWGPWFMRAAYLIPMGICLLLAALVLRWPRLGGLLMVGAGIAFSAWWWPMMWRRSEGQMTLAAFLSLFIVSGIFVIIGGLFAWEGQRLIRLRRDADWQPPARWWVRRGRWLVGIGVPLVVALSLILTNVPRLLLRVDRGDRSAVLIAGNGVTLVWAPEGPGWARGYGPYPDGVTPPARYPGWNTLALYGRYGLDPQNRPSDLDASMADMAQYGLCRYLSADGSQLMDVPQDIWRMPTTDELVRSLGWRGQPSGCTWDGTRGSVTCRTFVDKDWPLWAPDWSPVYYWSGEEHDPHEAWYVSSSGPVSYQPKDWGNSRHGFRCVREPTTQELEQGAVIAP